MSVQASEPAEGEQPVSRLLVPVLTLGVTIAILSARALSIFLPVMAADLHTSVAVMGQIPALMLLLAGVLALVAGPLADRYGLRLTLVLGLLSVFVSTVATGLSPNLPILLAVTLVGAIARAAVLPAAQAVAVVTFGDEDARRRAIGWITSGLSAAGLIGIPIMTSLAGITSWRVSFFAMGVVALVAAVLLQRTLGEDAPRVAGPLSLRGLLGSYEPIRRHRPTALLLVSSLFSEIGIWSAFTYWSALLVEQHGLGIEAVGWAFFALSIVTFGGNMVVQGRVGKYPRPLMLVCRLWCGIGLGLAFGLPLSWPVCLAIVLLTAPTLSMDGVATTLVLTASSPASRATTLTLRSAATCIGTALGGAVGGVALAVGGYEAVGILAFVMLLVSTALAWWSRAGVSSSVRAAAT
jgi:predicted MFS family arabinose efflux permease